MQGAGAAISWSPRGWIQTHVLWLPLTLAGGEGVCLPTGSGVGGCRRAQGNEGQSEACPQPETGQQVSDNVHEPPVAAASYLPPHPQDPLAAAPTGAPLGREPWGVQIPRPSRHTTGPPRDHHASQ